MLQLLEEFQAFNKKFYVPNNAVLVVAGDIDVAAVKGMIEAYFGPIPRGEDIVRNFPKEDPITEPMRAKAYDLIFKFQLLWRLQNALI